MKKLNLIKINAVRTLFLVLVISSSSVILCNGSLVRPPRRPLIIDHDGGIDDFISCTLQLLYAPKRVKAITIAPADSFGPPALWVMKQLKKILLANDNHIPIGAGAYEGINPFPDEWRSDVCHLAGLDVWGDKKIPYDHFRQGIPSFYDLLGEEPRPSLDVLAEVLLESPVPVDILETGPCSNIVELLDNYPALKSKINRIYMMGGAFDSIGDEGGVSGNVEKKGTDGSAEWNIYNNPKAFKWLLSSGVHITLIPLNATQYTPIRPEFMSLLKALTDSSNKKAIHFVYDGLKIVQPLIDSGQYMFWDTLTSAIVINHHIIEKIKIMKINVVLDGLSMGKTFKDKNGFKVDVVTEVNQGVFENTVLDILLSNQIGSILN